MIYVQLCVCVYVHVCMCVCEHVCVCVYTHTHMLIETENRMVVTKGQGKRKWGDVGQMVQTFHYKKI